MSNATAPRPLVLSDATVITPDESVYGPYPYSDLQAFGFALVAFFAGLSLTACGLRVYSCRLSKGFLIGELHPSRYMRYMREVNHVQMTGWYFWRW